MSGRQEYRMPNRVAPPPGMGRKPVIAGHAPAASSSSKG